MNYRILQGNAETALAALEAASVDCVVTSPPYYGLRNYGGYAEQIGLEDTPAMYVQRLVGVFRQTRRVLKPGGTVWLNLGDSYASNGGAHGGRADNQRGVGAKQTHDAGAGDQEQRVAPLGFKPKDLMGIPWRVAFALQDDGWWLRQDIIWHKPNPMPESVTDRCTKAHEYVFLLTPSPQYYFNAEAIREPASYDGRKDTVMKGSAKYENGFVPGRMEPTFHARGHERWQWKDGQAVRNRRSVWTVSPSRYAEAHFATMPMELAQLCVLAGCPPGGTVLDPFAGSGTTLAAAIGNGRNAIGVELNPAYIRLAEKRLATVQPSLLEAQ